MSWAELFKIDKTYLGLFIMALVLMVFSYYSDKPLSSTDLTTIKGTLKRAPELGNHGGDMPREFARIILIERKEKYYAYDCSYDMINMPLLKKLRGGDLVKLGVKERRGKDSHMYYSLYSKYGNILSLEDFNSCYQNRWKVSGGLVLLFVVFIFFNIIKNYRRLKK